MHGYYLSDNPNNTTKWAFPDTFIAAYGYLIIWADDQVTQPGLHASFRLSNADESVILVGPLLSVIDRVDYGEQTANVSQGRFPNGTGSFRPMYPTPGSENLTYPPAYGIVINEFLTSNSNIVADSSGEYDDWIELNNTTPNTLNLKGHYLSDDATNMAKWPFPDVNMPPYSHLLIWADNQTSQPGLHANFKLGRNGGNIFFTGPDLNVIDQVIYPEQSQNISYGRSPNGVGSFTYMWPTPGFENLQVSVKNLTSTISALKIWPNPATASLNLFYPKPEQITIYNALFQPVYNQKVNFPATINIENWQAGVYFIQLENSFEKIIVQ